MLKESDSGSRLRSLRNVMRNKRLSAFILSSDDPHSSEYLSEYDKRRQWLSGFTGSAGMVIIELDQASLFTDGRYHQQAKSQLANSGWTVYQIGLPGVVSFLDYVAALPSSNFKIGVEPNMINYSDICYLKERGKHLVEAKDLVGMVWEEEGGRPERRGGGKIWIHDEKYAGESVESKLKEIRQRLTASNHTCIIISALDEIAWLFNLRGEDIAYNPVFFAHAIITTLHANLYVDSQSLSDEVRSFLESHQIKISSYESFASGLFSIKSTPAKSKVLVSEKASLAVVESLGIDHVEFAKSVVCQMKSVKNETEIQGFRSGHIVDGVALCRYFAWLEEEITSGSMISEFEAAEKLMGFRQSGNLFYNLSFPTISASGPNSAVVHYIPQKESSRILSVNEMYLCDSGAQYHNATTDITRTFFFGEPSRNQIVAYTAVLQANIAISCATFPVGTTGLQVDSVARAPLWKHGMDFRHATGHGVGSFLCVHESGLGLGSKVEFNVPLLPNQVISNEPGYYLEGSWGIRIENVMAVVDFGKVGDKNWLSFETLTMCPIQKKLVDATMLSDEERKWLDGYHKTVFEKLSPLLQNSSDSKTLAWLEESCTRI